MTATEYYEKKMDFLPMVMDAYNSLAAENDVIVIEGAGSPAEINLKRDDFVNMGLAKLVDAPVLLAGDIDRGGVFAQLYGTIAFSTRTSGRGLRGLSSTSSGGTAPF
jgi:adenosylcobyric acid synthase